MSMLHQAGLSYGFWQFAVEAAVHIYNRQPIRRHQWKCPITVWSDTVPDVSYFRVFGCRAFVHVPEAQRRKLEKKALELMFVGYEPGSKAWRFWNHSTRSVVVSRDVTFDEDSFPARLRGLPGPPDEPLSLPDPETDSDDEGPPDAPLFPDDNNFIPPPAPAPAPAPPAPAPPPPPVQPPAPPANPPYNPQPDPVGDIPPDPPAPRRHQRGRHPPVEEQPPSLARDRPRRENAGVPPKPPGQNLHGPGTPLEIDAGMGPKGGYKRKTTVETIQDEWEDNVDGIRAMLNAASAYKPTVPNMRRDAMASPAADKWHNAEKTEYDSLIENKTWVLVPRSKLPEGRKTVTSRWVYDLKHDGRYKARLVARGFTQVWGEDYNETFSPVARFESIRYLLAHAALEDWEIESMDVKTAFLNGELKEEIYMEQPDGWVEKGKEDWVCLLKKAIYGLKQASREWNAKIHQSLLKQGFVRTHSDSGVYVRLRHGGG